MAALDGTLANSAIDGAINPRLTSAMQGFEVDYWPAHAVLASAFGYGTVDNALPVAAHGRAIEGSISRAFSDDFYYRIHITPPVLGLGNIVSTQVQTVSVWNAWLNAVTLLDISGLSDGMTLDGPDVPLNFAPLREITWDLGVAQSGPASVDATIEWVFDGLPNSRLLVTGSRIVAWTFLPDWSKGTAERLAWNTDVLPSESRHEQRRAVRLSPRREFEIRLLIENDDRRLYDLLVENRGGMAWAIPIWPDVQLLPATLPVASVAVTCATSGRDFTAGGMALLRGATAFDSEMVEISTVGVGGLGFARPTLRSWPAGTRLYPARVARLGEQPQARRLTDRAVDVSATFVIDEASDWPTLDLPTYRGFPVYAARPDESQDLTSTFERALRVLDNPCGEPFTLDIAGRAFAVRLHRWKLNGTDVRSAFRSLLYTLRGRQVAIWMPTHSDDLDLAQTISAVSTVMVVRTVGYERFGLNQPGRQDIRIELLSGTAFHRRITNATAGDPGTEQLALSSALGQEVTPAAIRRISYLTLMRSQSDDTQLQHVTDVQGLATSSKLFVAVRDDEVTA